MRTLTIAFLLTCCISSIARGQRVDSLRDGALTRVVLRAGTGTSESSILTGRLQRVGGDSLRLMLDDRGAVATVPLSSVRWAGVAAPATRMNGARVGAHDGLFAGVLTAAVVSLASDRSRRSGSSEAVRLTAIVGGSTVLGAMYGASRRFTRWVQVRPE